MENLKLDDTSLRKYGYTMAAALAVFSIFLLIRHKPAYMYTLCAAGVFFAAGVIFPRSLKHVYKAWMRLAFILGWINTRILLVLMFYLVFTPIGLLMRLFRFDPLDRRLEPEKKTYWLPREPKPPAPEQYERQF